MKVRYILKTSVLMFAFAIIWNGIVHLVVLRGAESVLYSLRRPDFAGKSWISLIVTLLISVLFTIGFMRWRGKGGTIESVKYSLYFAAVVGTAVDLNQYVLYPLPFSLVAAWLFFGFIEFVAYGLIAEAVWRRTPAVEGLV